MTTTTEPVATEALLAPRPPAVDVDVSHHSSFRNWFSDTVVFAGRNIEHIRQIPEKLLDVTIGSPSELDSVIRATQPFAANPPTFDAERLVATIPIIEGTRLMEVMRALDAEGVDAVDLNRREATLDDVFLTLTDGVPAHDDPQDQSLEEVPA